VVFQVRGVSGLKPVILTHVGRALTAQQEKTHGKYWSFPFFKSLEIFNQDKLLLDALARQQLEQFGLVLVEGFFDVAALVESGCLNVGALMGSHMTEKQMERVKFINSHVAIPKIIIFLDRDETGISGTEKAVALLRNNGFSVEAFDWSGLPVVKDKIRDAGDIAAKQLQWLRRQGRI